MSVSTRSLFVSTTTTRFTPKQPANFKVFARLRLYRFIAAITRSSKVNAGRAREHVADESLVPRNVHETETHASFFQKSETEINRDSAALFFFEAVGIRPRQRLHERRLAVIDVAGCADNDVLYGGIHFCARALMLRQEEEQGSNGLLRSGDFVHDGLRGSARVRRSQNRPSHYDEICSCANRFGGCGCP